MPVGAIMFWGALFLAGGAPAVFFVLSLFTGMAIYSGTGGLREPSVEDASAQQYKETAAQFRPVDQQEAKPFTAKELWQIRCTNNLKSTPQRDCMNVVIPGQINPEFGREYVTKLNGRCYLQKMLDNGKTSRWICMDEPKTLGQLEQDELHERDMAMRQKQAEEEERARKAKRDKEIEEGNAAQRAQLDAAERAAAFDKETQEAIALAANPAEFERVKAQHLKELEAQQAELEQQLQTLTKQ